MMRAYSRVKPAQQALDEYRDSIKEQLDQESIPYRVASSRDFQRTRSTKAEYNDAYINTP